MTRLVPRALLPLTLAAACVAQSGCVIPEAINAASHLGSGYFERLEKQRTLERVARDWCLTIRASQVIPVYPLDEDIEVGDSYIVDTPIATLKQYWRSRGYLPIDHRFGRLQPQGFAAYYHHAGYGVTATAGVPRQWQFPEVGLPEHPTLPKTAPSSAAATGGAAESQAEESDEEVAEAPPITTWVNAPRAGFPSYSFRIKRGEGINVAIPVQGVPVAIAALGAREATGSVTLKDAYTYGIDEASVRQDIHKWESDPAINAALRSYAAQPPVGHCLEAPRHRNFLRVVTRVYLVRGVEVNLTNTDASVFKGSVGAPKGADKNITFSTKDKAEDLLLANLQSNIASQELIPAKAATASEESADGDSTAADDKSGDQKTGAAETADAAGAADAADQDPELTKREADLDRMEKELDLADRESQLKHRQASRLAANKIAGRLLERSEMADRFGGYQLPGGTLQVTSATSNSISINETFARPLVIGYHALEFEILPDGHLGAHPVSTFQRLESDREPSGDGALVFGPADKELTDRLADWVNLSDENFEKARRWMKDNEIVNDPSLFIRARGSKMYACQVAMARAFGLI